MIELLNLYTGLPVSDPHHLTNTTGYVRFIGDGDPLTKAVLQRYQGDVQHRTNLISNKINELVQVINQNPFLRNISDTPYVRIDGTRPFTSPVSGVTPTAPSHLTTKAYVDGTVGSLQTAIGTVSSDLTSFKGASEFQFTSPWTQYNWSPGNQVVVDLQVAQVDGSNPGEILGIELLERLDIAVPTQANPNPPAEYVFRRLTAYQSFAVDDMFYVSATRTLRVLVPNINSYSSGYSDPVYDKMMTPRSRHLKAVISATKS